MDGRTAIFGLTPPGTKLEDNPFAAYAFHPEALAFAANAPSEARAPSQTPEGTDGSSFWRELWFGPRPRSIDADTSAMLVKYSQILMMQSPFYHMANRALWQILSLGAPVGAAPVGNAFAQIGIAMEFAGLTSNPPQNWNLPRLLDFDPRMSPSSAALLAVRAARRAVAENPQDVHAYLALADSLEFLWGAEEQNWSRGQELFQLRQIQRVAALRKALPLATKSDDLIDIHKRLAIAYFWMGIVDLSSEHDNKALELMTAAGHKPKESQEDFQKRIDQFKSTVKAREERNQLDVQRSKYQLANRQSNSRARRASEAIQRRLYQEALKVLIDNDEAVDLEPNEARLALDLLIRVGRLDDARALDTEEPFFQFRIAAASGDYAKADEALVRYLDRLKKDNVDNLLFLMLNSTWARPLGPNGQPLGMGPEMLLGLQSPAAFVRSWADWSVLRGVLALEAGDQAQAEEHFRHALRLGESPAINTIVTGLYGLRTPLEAAAFLGAKHSGPPIPFSFSEQGLAVRYLSLLRAAKDQSAKKAR
jgi:tetratricopeptide (TPR) repeat protein